MSIPDGWLPIPFALTADAAEAVAPELLAASGAVPGEGADVDEATHFLAAAMARLPVTTRVAARMWHGFGEVATGVVADLSVEERAADTLDAAAPADFPHADLQRREAHDDGALVTLSVVTPTGAPEVAFLLRVQVPTSDGLVRIVDVLDRDTRALGAVWDDALQLARG